jgi:hypothetical protein
MFPFLTTDFHKFHELPALNAEHDHMELDEEVAIDPSPYHWELYTNSYWEFVEEDLFCSSYAQSYNLFTLLHSTFSQRGFSLCCGNAILQRLLLGCQV